MCGFVGWINIDHEKPVDPEILKKMNQTLSHRGPDDEGYFVEGNVGIAHRRLSIIDLSSEALQPVFNEDKSILVVLNGEIYNYKLLKNELEKDGHIFSTLTDTEVIVHAYEKWGIGFLNKLDGMFSLALFDKGSNTLILAKDPFGKKPLYYTLQNGIFLFASELKAFFSNPHFKKILNLSSVSKYLAYEYVPTPHTIFEHCKKLPAASYIKLNTKKILIFPEPEKYWNLQYEPKLVISKEEASLELISLLKGAIQKRLMSDVPLGVFLSGGLDSSTIIALLSEVMPVKRIKTFNIGFSEKSFDESSYARLVANHFETDHYEDILDPEKMLDVFPTIIKNLDEPFADASIIPTYLLCNFAKEHVTVALSGDGGDELLAGYDPFVALKFSFLLQHMPNSILEKLRVFTSYIPPSSRNMPLNFRLKHFLKGFSPFSKSNLELRNNMWLGAFMPDALQMLFNDNQAIDLVYQSLYSETIKHSESKRASNPIDRMIDNYINLYLHDDILVKTDRASMMNSLEVRAPFLDKNLAQFINKLPSNMKIHNFSRKHILKKAISSKLPADIVKRPKKGFGIPLSKWFAGPLKEMLADTFSESKISQNGLFNIKFIKKLLFDQFNGFVDNRKEIWTLFVFELWMQRDNL